MRTLLCVIAAFVVTLSLSACGDDESSNKPTPPATATGSPITATPPPSSNATSVEEVQALEDGINYYMSDQRRVQLQTALNSVGMDLALKMLAKKIPSATRGWNKTSPAPDSGYGVLYSTPSRNSTYVDVVVKFTDGKVDLSEGVLGLSIQKDGVTCVLTGGRPLDSQGQPIANSPVSFSWIIEGGMLDRHMYLVYRDKPGIPNRDTRLSTGKQYKVGGDGAGTRTDIIAQDQVFLNLLTSQQVNGFDW